MSHVIVPVTTISGIRHHPNADHLEIAEVLGWQVVIPEGAHEVGDMVVYVPPDAVVPQELSDKWGVTKYLSNGRVRCVKLRGEPSFGFVVPAVPSWEIGENIAQYLGITKYEPPYRPSAGDAEVEHPLFMKYTEIENLRHFPDVLIPGERVVITEKIHGTNCRVGMINGELMAGSMQIRRKEPEDYKSNTYWFPLSLPSVRKLFDLLKEYKQVILFGEVYGKGVQNLHYGRENSIGFAAFDLMIDGSYQSYDLFSAFCDTCQVPTVPVLYEWGFDPKRVKDLSIGNTVLGGDNIREGIVIKPAVERSDPRVGRIILKYISDDYLIQRDSGKHSDFTEA